MEGVAKRCKSFADVFGAGDLAYLAGILHDIGKYSAEFQERIRGSSIRADHSTAGAQWIMRTEVHKKVIGSKFDMFFARLVAYVIAGHHGGLRNYGTTDEEGTLKHRLSKSSELIPEWAKAWDEIDIAPAQRWNIPLFQVKGLTNYDVAWKYSFFGRMLYSCLVDADSIDTRDYCNDDDRMLMSEKTAPSMEQLLIKFNEYMRRKMEHTEDTVVNRYRRLILEACDRQAESKLGLFTLSVPTGGGKTLSSLSFALHHAKKNGLHRIIYVIPFTSIIDQTAKIFREALGAEVILEHHSNFDEEEYQENYGPDEVKRLKLSTENWDASVIVTTSVQFFESLFSNKRSKCRKLHNIANSAIIIDEAQSIPRGYVTPCIRAMEELVQSYGCSVVLCTATQPTWKELGTSPIEMMDQPTPDQLLKVFKRVEVTVHGNASEVVSDTNVIEWMTQSEQVLCIVNTRKHAKLLLDQLEEEQLSGVYHLSGRMYGKHRMGIIEEIKDRLKNSLPCRVISTQLIEAGVDVDFPLVLRSMTGLDSIAQAAGRCNREGRMAMGEVRVFYPDKHGMPSKGWMKETAIEAQHVLQYEQESPLSITAMQRYFDRIYGICDGNVAQVTDSKNIMALSKSTNLEIPYEDIAKGFEFIEGNTHAIVIPHDDKARALIDKLEVTKYPMQLMRQLQPYTVQVYSYELIEFKQKNLLASSGGVLYLLDLAYYSERAGLLQPDGFVEHEVFIF